MTPNGNGGLTRMGVAVVSMLTLLGGALLIGWHAASTYQSDLAELRQELAEQRGYVELILDHFQIERPKRRR